MTKNENFYEKSSGGLLFIAKILHEAIHLTSLTRVKSLTKFSPNIQDFKRVLDLNWKLKRIEPLNFFN